MRSLKMILRFTITLQMEFFNSRIAPVRISDRISKSETKRICIDLDLVLEILEGCLIITVKAMVIDRKIAYFFVVEVRGKLGRPAMTPLG